MFSRSYRVIFFCNYDRQNHFFFYNSIHLFSCIPIDYKLFLFYIGIDLGTHLLFLVPPEYMEIGSNKICTLLFLKQSSKSV